MADEKFKLFREKSIETIESPESLTDYLKVTSPGVWLLLGAVAVLLIGVIVWGIYGRIETDATVAVAVTENESCAYIPVSAVEYALKEGVITVNGVECVLNFDTLEAVSVSQDTDVRVRINGGYAYGDLVYRVGVDTTLESGFYSGVLTTESLKPISLLFN